jgi:hypothetical protein
MGQTDKIFEGNSLFNFHQSIRQYPLIAACRENSVSSLYQPWL